MASTKSNAQPLEKNMFYLMWTEITKVIFSIVKVALQQFREPFLRGIRQKWGNETGEDPINLDPP